MPAPLLIADVPWLLYRSFFALPKSIVGADGQPVNALLGHRQRDPVAFRCAPAGAAALRGVVACMGAEQADYRVRLYPPYHAHRDPMPPELAAQWQQAPALLESLGWTYATSDELEADDVMFSLRARRAGARRAGAADDRRPRPVRRGQRARRRGRAAEGRRARTRSGRRRCASATASSPSRCPTSSRCAATPPTACPGAPGIGAKTAAELLRAHGTLEALLSAAGADAHADDADAAAVRASRVMRPRVAAALRENAELLRKFKQIATLQRIDVEPPPDRATDFAGGARSPRASWACTASAERLRGYECAS